MVPPIPALKSAGTVLSCSAGCFELNFKSNTTKFDLNFKDGSGALDPDELKVALIRAGKDASEELMLKISTLV